MTKFLLSTFIAILVSTLLIGQSTQWADIPDPKRDDQQIVPAAYRTMSVDFESLKAQLLAAPGEGTSVRESNYILQLPTPDGARAGFKIVEESVMELELQESYPNIRTFVGIGTGDYANAQISLDFTLKGFHAQILRDGKSYYIDPIAPGELNTYIVYTRESFFKANSKVIPSCGTDDIGLPQPGNAGEVPVNGQNANNSGDVPFPQASNGTELRTYQLALACTGEYAQFHGGTVPLVLSAMTTTMSRVNGIFRSELSLRMLLVANNDDLIFLNAITDGYTNNSGSAMLGENQAKVDAIIGSANYDIGHVFSTGGGGIAGLGVVCNNGSKARGVTGQASPIGDPFDVDYVSHEMGHQWDATHTQNNSCNRTSSSAFEPGSASTIMGYAGICSPNLQSNSDDHFHNHSYNQMRTYSVDGNGNSCATITDAINTPPVITMPSGGFFIPRSTPFELTASATDPNNDAMTYCWEQYDLGPATAAGDNNLTNPSGNAPIFRSWSPTSSPTRVFPRISDLVNNTTVIGELLPTYARDLTFRLTVRDLYTNGAVNDAQISFDVAGNSGPFVVTSPNSSVSWTSGSTQTVTWDVANTTASPVSCSNVSIYLSTDGGFTYPTLLVASTANDGSASVTMPEIVTSTARIKVKGNGNIFFDISNQNFSIQEGATPPGNDAICNAITINCGDNLEGTTVNAIPSILGEPSCSAGTENDVFYSFNATEGNTYTITVNGENYDGVLAIYSGFCFGPLTELACADNGFSPNIAETIEYTAEEDGVIYIQTYDWSATEGDFNITLDCVFANEDPCDAQLISCGETVNGSTVGAASSVVGVPSCGSGTDSDVFYKLEAIAGVNYTVTVNGSNYDGIIAAYTGSCSGSLTELDCSDVGIGTGLIETINFSVAFNRTVYIQTYDWSSTGGEFTLIVSCANLPYDDPCEARSLVCGESFSGSSAGATQSSIGSPTCTNGSQNDVFFTFTAEANSTYSITVNGDQFDGVLAAYAGNCDGELTELDCSDSGLSSGIAETVEVTVGTATEILLQVYDYFGNGVSDFTITLECPVPDNDDCGDAEVLSVNQHNDCEGNETIGTTTGATSSGADACESSSPDVYYSFNSGDNTAVIVNLEAISADDLVLSLFEASCGSTAIFCAISTSQSPLIEVEPFTTYYVRVHSFSADLAGTFSLCVENAFDCPALGANIGDACNDENPLTLNDVVLANCSCSGAPVNDECTNATSLSVNEPEDCAGNETLGTTSGASSSDEANCETTSPDVYYSFNSGSYENVIINLNTISAGDLVISVFEENCDGAVLVSCSIGVNQNLNVVVNPGTNYIVRIHSFISVGNQGDFNICVEGVAADVASLNGSINGWNNSCAARDMEVSLIDVPAGVDYIGINSTLNPDGSFALVGLDIIPGTYDILVKVDGGLAKLLQNVVISSGTNSISVPAIVLGDLNNNNVINVTDYSLLGAAFGSVTGDANFSFRADLNCNGAVNVTDLSILGLGFGQSGDSFPL